MELALDTSPADGLPISAFDLFSNPSTVEPKVIVLPDLPLQEIVIEAKPKVEAPAVEVKKAAPPFDLTTLLLTLRALPDVKLKMRAPFGEDGTYNLDVHNKAKWLLVAFNEGHSVIQIDDFMSFNPSDDSWDVLSLKQVEFKEMDPAINHIKSLLEV